MCELALSSTVQPLVEEFAPGDDNYQEVPAPAPGQHALVPYDLAREARIAARHEKLVELQVVLSCI